MHYFIYFKIIIFGFCIIILSGCGTHLNDKSFLKKLPPGFDYQEIDLSESIKKPPKDMSFKEAAIAKAYFENEKDTDMVIKCGQRLLAVGGNQEIMRQTYLQIAELSLEQDDYEKAEKYAHDYQTLYPGTEETKKAAFINIKSTFLASPSADRDQTKTEKTIELAEEFFNTYKNDTEYFDAIHSILHDCYKKLLDREISVTKMYLNKFNYYNSQSALNAARKRVAHVKQKLLPQVKDQEQHKKLELVLAGFIEKNDYLKESDQKEKTYVA